MAATREGTGAERTARRSMSLLAVLSMDGLQATVLCSLVARDVASIACASRAHSAGIDESVWRALHNELTTVAPNLSDHHDGDSKDNGPPPPALPPPASPRKSPPATLPEGWTVAVRERTANDAHHGSRYKLWRPPNGRKWLRSWLEVLRYLADDHAAAAAPTPPDDDAARRLTPLPRASRRLRAACLRAGEQIVPFDRRATFGGALTLGVSRALGGAFTAFACGREDVAAGRAAGGGASAPSHEPLLYTERPLGAPGRVVEWRVHVTDLPEPLDVRRRLVFGVSTRERRRPDGATPRPPSPGTAVCCVLAHRGYVPTPDRNHMRHVATPLRRRLLGALTCRYVFGVNGYSGQTYPLQFGAGDVVSVLLDVDKGVVRFGKNGVLGPPASRRLFQRRGTNGGSSPPALYGVCGLPRGARVRILSEPEEDREAADATAVRGAAMSQDGRCAVDAHRV